MARTETPRAFTGFSARALSFPAIGVTVQAAQASCAAPVPTAAISPTQRIPPVRVAETRRRSNLRRTRVSRRLDDSMSQLGGTIFFLCCCRTICTDSSSFFRLSTQRPRQKDFETLNSKRRIDPRNKQPLLLHYRTSFGFTF